MTSVLHRGSVRSVGTLLALIRFSHTLFALPWALAGLMLGSGGWPQWHVLGWVLVAMVGARTAAMTWNRLVDRRLDATNPRTASRPSVTGEVTLPAMIAMVSGSAAVFVFAAYMLNPLCGHLSWPTLALLLFYSYTKRFTAGAHWVLGIGLGLSPVGAYLAARGTFDLGAAAAGALGLAVTLWTAGFDILYACQDVDHDRREGLHSVPARLGIGKALMVARACHALVPFALLLAAWFGSLGGVYLAGVAVVAVLLVWEHRLVRADDLSKVGKAFFQVNVLIAVIMLVATAADVVTGGGS